MNIRTTGLALSLALLTACGGGSSNNGNTNNSTTGTCEELNSSSFNCQTMLTQLVDEAIKPNVQQLKTDVDSLSTDVSAYCTAVKTDSGSSDTEQKRTTAQNSWIAAMSTWQTLEVMQVGPVAQARDDMHYWPLNNSCNVDREITVASGNSNYQIADKTESRRGLDALEYLLFADQQKADCDSEPKANEALARCEFAVLVADDLKTRADTLANNVSTYQLTNSAATAQAAANLVSNALFYIDKQTKDAKLRDVFPATANSSFNADKLEFQWAPMNAKAIEYNLKGAKQLMEAGLDDYLTAAGQQSLATNMVQALDDAVSAAQALDGKIKGIVTDSGNANKQSDCLNASTADANASDLVKLCSLDDHIRVFTNDLKDRFVLTLNFSTPATAQGDND